MFLYKKQNAYSEVKGTLRVTRKGEPLAFMPGTSIELKETIGYWRKANQVHRWFVNNVQEGEDNCKEYVVSRNKLAELLGAAQTVIIASELIPGSVSVGQTLKDSKWVDILEPGFVIKDSAVAKDLLPVCEGFFFGGYHYDEYYVSQLKETVAILGAALTTPDGVEFTYQSSW